MEEQLKSNLIESLKNNLSHVRKTMPWTRRNAAARRCKKNGTFFAGQYLLNEEDWVFDSSTITNMEILWVYYFRLKHVFLKAVIHTSLFNHVLWIEYVDQDDNSLVCEIGD